MRNLDKLLTEAKTKFASMSLKERKAMYEKQCEGYVRAEASWPKPKFRWVNGVKVYESYKDYCND